VQFGPCKRHTANSPILYLSDWILQIAAVYNATIEVISEVMGQVIGDLIGEYCSHRLASMYFGRNETSGMRCVYHGWKFGHDGRCIDMPHVPPEDDFKDKVRHPAYPCAERGGVIWTYMGPADPPPGLPDLEWAMVPEGQCLVSKFYQECNYIPRASIRPAIAFDRLLYCCHMRSNGRKGRGNT
jgi:nitrite reductase/ring-hydroxylating ferredoxin subunit